MVEEIKIVDEAKLDRAMFLALNRTFVKELVKATPGSGNLASQWEFIRTEPFEYVLVNPLGDLVIWNEFGTRPRIIKAKGDGWLRFKKPTSRKSKYKKIPGNRAFEEDGFIFAKKVRHPGFKGRFFLKETLGREDLFKEFEKQVGTILGLE